MNAQICEIFCYFASNMLTAVPFSLPIADPTWIFFLVLGLILFVPMVLERLHIPSIVGLIGAGILVGPYGFDILAYDASFSIFGKVGIYYIMFLASLEMNMEEVKRIKGQALVFGLLSFLFPFVLGFFANESMGYALPAGVLMAAMYSSHTLLSYPIVLRFGIGQRRSVSIATGGTIVADTLTLIVLAIIGGIFKEGTTGWYWVFLAVKILAIGGGIIYAFPRLGRWFFRRVDDSVAQYVFVLVLVFAGAGLMQLVGMEGILGAFLVGLVLNKLIPPVSPIMSHIEFVGNSIFIPYFLIGVGMIINIGALAHGHAVFLLALVMVGVCVVGKYLAAFATQKIYGLKAVDRTLMFGLTNSRAAATLAVVLVGHEIVLPSGGRLLDETVLNATMLLILVTCIISPFVTERVARRIAMEAPTTKMPNVSSPMADRILIAVSNPETRDPLVHLALYLRPPQTEQPLMAVNVILEDKIHLRERGAKQLEAVERLASTVHVPVQTFNRWSVNIVSGISHTVLENEVSDLLLGLHHQKRLGENFLGHVTEDLINAVSQQVMVYFPMVAINTIRRIHLLIPREAEFEPSFAQWARRIAFLAQQLSCVVELYGGRGTLAALSDYWQEQKMNIPHEAHEFRSWHDLISIAHAVKPDHMIAFVMARRSTISYQPYMERLPNQIGRYFSNRTLLLIYPNQQTASPLGKGSRSVLPTGVKGAR